MVKPIMSHPYSAIYILLNKNNVLAIKNFNIMFYRKKELYDYQYKWLQNDLLLRKFTQRFL